MERKLQSKIIKWLKENKAYVVKTKPAPGTPVGCPDILFFRREKWGAIEVKADEKSPYQPGQEATLNYLRKGNDFVYKAYPDNWHIIKQDLEANFF